MSFTYRILYRNCYCLNLTKPVRWSFGKHQPGRKISNFICYRSNLIHRPLAEAKQLGVLSIPIRQCTQKTSSNETPSQKPEGKKPGLFQRFKEMYRDYWYVLGPVHCVTSAVWFGSFYYAVRSGVDVLSLFESIGVSEKLLAPLRESSAGYFALAFALYKLITPLRYAVTIGGTTYAIRRLTSMGWIKPVPSRERIKEMLQEGKDNLQDRFNESKQHYQSQIKEKRTQVMDEMRRYKDEMRNMKKKKVKKT